MNKKFLAISMTLLMILGTLSVLVPQAHAQILPITANPTTGAPGTTVVVTPGLGAAALPLHNIFVMFDTDVADPDEGQALIPFVGVAPAVIAAGDELYMDLNFVALPHTYTAGEPIYLIGPLNPSIGAVTPAVVWPGDTRLRTVTVGATVYPAESTVALGDLDTLLAANLWQFVPTVLAATAGVGHTDPDLDGIFTVGEEIVWDTDYNNLITPGDQRLAYNEYTDSVLLTDPTTAGRLSVPLGSVVRGHVFDYQEGLYVDANGNGIVDLGDTRVRDVVVPDVFYANSDPVLAGDRDTQAGFVTTAFTTAFLPVAPFDEVYVDLNADLQYTYGEPVYNAAGFAVATGWVVTVGDVRWSYVAIGPGRTTFYLPGSTVAAGDADIGLAYTHFNSAVVPGAVAPFEEYFDLNGNGVYDCAVGANGVYTCDWIYRVATAGGPPAVGDVRLTNVAYSDNWSNLVVPAPADAQQAQIIAAGTVVAAHDGDVCPDLPWARCWGVAALQTRLLPIPGATTSPVTGQPNWMYYDVAVNGYTPEDTMYIDNDANAAISVGDERLTPVRTALALPMPALTQVADPGDWYMPHSIVQLGEADLALVPLALTQFGAFPLVDPTSFAENVIDDNTYSTELMVNAAVDGAGLIGPFPLPAAGYPANQPLTFQIPAPLSPSGKPRGGNHVILLTQDVDPRSAAGFPAPWVNIGFLQAAAAIVDPGAGLKNPMTSLAWSDGTAANYRWNYNDMNDFAGTTTAGPVYVWVQDLNVRMFLHPGVADPYKPGWSHTLDTLWGTQAGLLGDPTPGQPGTNRQTREFFDNYLDYAILASASDSVGDLQFDITVLAAINWLEIYVPPEFRWLADTREEAIWTDITNDYGFIWSVTRTAYDPIAPNWVRVRIGMDQWEGTVMTIAPGTYHVRFFDLAAPSVAGLYHFKIYVNGVSIGAGNYPVMIVKSELNPAFVEVTVRAHLNFAPPFISGSVLADGTTPEGRAVSAIGYWGPMEFIGMSLVPNDPGALYRLFIFGLAAGTYTLTAQGSGYSPTITDRITLMAGQSYTIFIVIFDSPDVHVTIWSKHGTGAIPWHNLWQLPFGTNNPAIAPNNAAGWPRRDMMIELYNANGELVSWWASDWAVWKWIPASNTLVGLHDDGTTIPTANQYNAQLCDNFDVFGNLRFYPSTHWDGHIPWTTADYIAGMPNGQYTVEAFVTGYIMDETDAYQRSFSLVGSSYNLQFDLRRTNWIETAMHLPANVFLSVPTTVTLTAEDAALSERGALAFEATPAMSLDGDLDGVDATVYASARNAIAIPAYAGGIILEGWNGLFPNFDNRGDAQDINVKDYGLNPTASTHSAGAVTLAGNPYTQRLYMSDMGLPAAGILGTGWYNIVGGDPMVSVFLCNSPQLLSFSIVNAWLWISLRSVDFEVPAHSRPWTFPGSEIWVEFINADGDQVDVLDPTIYGLVQDAGMTVPGFPILGAPAGSFGVTPFDIDNLNPAGRHEHVGVNYYGTDVCSLLVGFWPEEFALMPGWRSTRLPAGQYSYTAWTHGYVQRRSFPVQVPFAGGADIEADLIQGGQIRVIMDFKHEAIATGFNGFVRVEVFNENNELVGASIYGQADANAFTLVGTPNGAYLPYAAGLDWMLVPGPAQGADFGQPPALFPSSTALVSNGQRAYTSWAWYGIPASRWAFYAATLPADANRVLVPPGSAQAFDVYGYYWYYGAAARTWAGGWPTTNGWNQPTWTGAQWDQGIKGTVDIPGWEGSGGGLYTVKVWAFDPRGPNNAFEAANPTDDWRMYSMGWELTGVDLPWGGSVELFVTMNNMATLRGTVSWLTMYGDMRPLPWAQVIASPGPAFDQYPASASGNGAIGAGSSDPSGGYIMWLPAGTHSVMVSTSEAPQIWSSSSPTLNAEYTVVVSDGWVGGGDTRLGTTGTAVPEVPAFMAPLVLIAALAASVWLLRRRNLNIPVWIK